ncbi:ABC transporter substrate-binding protein [Thalassococcus sp. S3]|uniref:ABC transporter substrate-binding protein n=1 Tax=Thalassococcus sp. S3 TaxID=2017482 RepID=UPI0020C28716|nr:ABC transporter substrate-binding protein [Thalassococcus sp. S3]
MNLRHLSLLALLLAGAQSPVGAAPPERVVSMNLCTDQIAMLVAAPGQLYSVSHLSADPRISAMATEAEELVINHGLAEEIYLMEPDLVIAGSFSTRATVEMLKRLGMPVAVFEPAYGLDDVRERLQQMGEVLGQEDTARSLIEDLDQRLDVLRAAVGHRPSAALYYANGYTSGDRTLAGQILIAAGFENAAAAAGYSSGGVLPLEVLAMLDPEAVITGHRYPGASRAEDILDHPVVQTLREGRASGAITDRDWVCGTPFVLSAIEDLSTVRKDLLAD